MAACAFLIGAGVTVAVVGPLALRPSSHGRTAAASSLLGTTGSPAPVARLPRAHVLENRPVFPDAPWGRATLEVILAILESAREHRDVQLEWQVPAPV